MSRDLFRKNLEEICEGVKYLSGKTASFDRVHVESPDCWCEPELVYVDGENGNAVWVHRTAEQMCQ